MWRGLFGSQETPEEEEASAREHHQPEAARSFHQQEADGTRETANSADLESLLRGFHSSYAQDQHQHRLGSHSNDPQPPHQQQQQQQQQVSWMSPQYPGHHQHGTATHASYQQQQTAAPSHQHHPHPHRRYSLPQEQQPAQPQQQQAQQQQVRMSPDQPRGKDFARMQRQFSDSPQAAALEDDSSPPAAATAAAAAPPQNAAAPPQNRNTTTTGVNGIGLWNSWTRNFSTPVQAMLDLVDNAFDAAPPDGKILIRAEDGSAGGATIGGGLTMFNTCAQAVAPLAEVLEVYKSVKGSGHEHIGENGVGLKQGCATLSDCSFVLTRNESQYSLGVIAKTLQSPEGISLPSFVFTAASHASSTVLRAELMELCSKESQAAVAQVVASYGGGELEAGVERLVDQFGFMSTDKWGRYAFGLILCDIKQGSSIGNGHNSGKNSHLIRQLQEKLPEIYIHVPSEFEVRIDYQLIQFHYWQRRLVDLTRFALRINPTNPVSAWTSPHDLLVNTQELEDNVNPYRDNGYILHVYLGFDALRVAGTGADKEASLYWYSRKQGRLIKRIGDARADLGLNATGTQFCQGLTVIVDDLNGQLPLNPTKQDVAFGEQGAMGEIHRQNLKLWIGAVTKIFYQFHLDRYNGLKKTLTERVKEKVPDVQALSGGGAERSLKALSKCRLDRFFNFDLSYRPTSKAIWVRSKKNIRRQCQNDTLIRLRWDPPPPAVVSAPVKKRERVSNLARLPTLPTLPDTVAARPTNAELALPPPTTRDRERARFLALPPSSRREITPPAARKRSRTEESEESGEETDRNREEVNSNEEVVVEEERNGPTFGGLPLRLAKKSRRDQGKEDRKRPSERLPGKRSAVLEIEDDSTEPEEDDFQFPETQDPDVSPGRQNEEEEEKASDKYISRKKHEQEIRKLRETCDRRLKTMGALMQEKDTLENTVSILEQQLNEAKQDASQLKTENADLKLRNETFKLQVAKLNRKVEQTEADSKEWQQLCLKLQGVQEGPDSSDDRAKL